LTNIILSIASFFAALLLYGAWKLRQRDGLNKQVWLMIGAALVIIANVAIWTIPDGNGNSLAQESAKPVP
jgi:NO-binding membrane sensor protein with MHYT domain